MAAEVSYKIMLTFFEKIEVLVISLFGIGVWFITPLFSNKLDIGNVILAMSALLLFQGLMRDLFILAKSKKNTNDVKFKTARCMCLESTVGITGILIGIGVLSSSSNQAISLNSWKCWTLSMLVMIIGFLVKDFVVETNPWRIIRDKDHMNILFKWK